MSVRVTVDASDALREVRRLKDGPDVQDILRLEAVLTGLFQETQFQVHVITGSLRGSGKADSVYRNEQWRGVITYGGASPGHIHDPVRYAALEHSRGGAHDFFATIVGYDKGYVEGILAFLRGGVT